MCQLPHSCLDLKPGQGGGGAWRDGEQGEGKRGGKGGGGELKCQEQEGGGDVEGQRRQILAPLGTKSHGPWPAAASCRVRSLSGCLTSM